MAELMRPMDVFALMVACIGHDVGHPGLTNAYMVRFSPITCLYCFCTDYLLLQVNANAPVAQIYDNKSILENFHNVTLIHMLRKHNFEYLLGGDFGRRGAQATDFRKILEAAILATDMSRHFAIVTEITEMARTLGKKREGKDIEAERLLLCSGLIKCADISNPVRLLPLLSFSCFSLAFSSPPDPPASHLSSLGVRSSPGVGCSSRHRSRLRSSHHCYDSGSERRQGTSEGPSRFHRPLLQAAFHCYGGRC